MAMPLTAETIAKALGGRKRSGAWMARCPTHEDREPSLSIRDADDGKVLVRCHAGCDQEQVIAALRSRGLWKEKGHRWLTRPVLRVVAPDRSGCDGAKRTEAALAIWEAAMPAGGTPVETYLAARGIHLQLPTTLRFHARLKHPSGGIWPAMVALVTRGADDTRLAIHRTFLARDGGGKAPVDSQKIEDPDFFARLPIQGPVGGVHHHGGIRNNVGTIVDKAAGYIPSTCRAMCAT